jgi:hypothetical protein
MVEIEAGTKGSYSSKGLLASGVIKAKGGTILGVMGFNDKDADQYIQIFDSATVPDDAAVPTLVIEVTAKSNFSISFGENGYKLPTGISWSNSTTLATKTIGADDVWLNAVYS